MKSIVLYLNEFDLEYQNEDKYRRAFGSYDMTNDEANKRMNALKNDDGKKYHIGAHMIEKLWSNDQDDNYKMVTNSHSMTNDELNKRMGASQSRFPNEKGFFTYMGKRNSYIK